MVTWIQGVNIRMKINKKNKWIKISMKYKMNK